MPAGPPLHDVACPRHDADGDRCPICLAEHVDERAAWYEQHAERSRTTAEVFDAKAALRRRRAQAAGAEEDLWFAQTAIGNRSAAAVFAARARELRAQAHALRMAGPALCA